MVNLHITTVQYDKAVFFPLSFDGNATVDTGPMRKQFSNISITPDLLLTPLHYNSGKQSAMAFFELSNYDVCN